MIDGGIVGGYYGVGGSRSGGSARGAVWTPTITNIKVNGVANTDGTLTILSASYVGDTAADAFQVYYHYAPPSGVNLSSLEFEFSFPFNTSDFYGYTSVFYNEHNATRDYISGETGGGGIFATEDEDAEPYTKGNVQIYMDNSNAHNQYPILGLVEGVLIPQTS